jgi:hypothetical protein
LLIDALTTKGTASIHAGHAAVITCVVPELSCRNVVLIQIAAATLYPSRQ